jgi:hypothetical protein
MDASTRSVGDKPRPGPALAAPSLLPRFFAAPDLHGVLDAAHLIHHVHERKPGMPQGHSWAGVAHDHACLFPLGTLVAVDGALGAGRLGLAIGTFLEPPGRVIEKLAALSARPVLTGIPGMMIGAPDSDHAFHGAELARQPGRQEPAGGMIMAARIHMQNLHIRPGPAAIGVVRRGSGFGMCRP